MAVGDKILSSWISGVWSSINNLISKYSNGLTSLASYSTTASASDMANLNSKFNQIKNDYYLSAEAALFTTISTSQGGIIYNSVKSSIDNTISNTSVIICKNVATYTNTAKSNGNKSNESESNGTRTHGTQSRGATSNSRSGYSSNSTVKNGQGSNSNGDKENGDKSNGTKSNGTCSNGTNSNGTVVQLRNSNTTAG